MEVQEGLPEAAPTQEHEPCGCREASLHPEHGRHGQPRNGGCQRGRAPWAPGTEDSTGQKRVPGMHAHAQCN